MGGQQQAAGVDEQVVLAALDFLVAVKALVQYAPLAAFDRLGVGPDHAGRGLARRGGPLAVAANQRLVKLRPAPVGLPAPEIVVVQGVGGELAREQAPLAAAFGQV